jgi:hypothetical protein
MLWVQSVPSAVTYCSTPACTASEVLAVNTGHAGPDRESRVNSAVQTPETAPVQSVALGVAGEHAVAVSIAAELTPKRNLGTAVPSLAVLLVGDHQ